MGMITVTFISPRLFQPLRVNAAAGTRLIDAVRAEATAGRLPLSWRCGQGTCGACLVRVAHALQPQALLMRNMERNVLIRAGHLPPAPENGNGQQVLADTPETLRLACHIVLAHDLIVYF